MGEQWLELEYGVTMSLIAGLGWPDGEIQEGIEGLQEMCKSVAVLDRRTAGQKENARCILAGVVPGFEAEASLHVAWQS